MKTVGDVVHELEKISDAQQNLHCLKDRLEEMDPVSARMCEDVIILLAHYRHTLCELPIRK